jgi:hypothetical protein
MAGAIEHFSNTKIQASIDRRRKVKDVLKSIRELMEASPRGYCFMQELRFHDITHRNPRMAILPVFPHVWDVPTAATLRLRRYPSLARYKGSGHID